MNNEEFPPKLVDMVNFSPSVPYPVTRIHTAGKPDGLIQKCSRCGYVLQDYTNVQGVGTWHPVWWLGNVYVRGSILGATEEKATCELQSPDPNLS